VALGLERVQALALVLHELATNAVKYGALKPGSGRLDIAWDVEPTAVDGSVLRLTWLESGVTMPTDTTRRGYGRRLIERSLGFTLHATSEFSLGEDGVRCHIQIPLPGTTFVGPEGSI
jgi:two-component system CheB/CheR fusion protein